MMVRVTTLLTAAACWLVYSGQIYANETPEAAPAQDDASPPVAASAAKVPAEADPDELVCRYEKPTGSHMRVKVCRTRAQIKAEEEEKQRLMDVARSRGNQLNANGG